MAYNPGVSFFIPFHDLEPSKDGRCIFFTQAGKRCRWTCQGSDNMRAIVLHGIINAASRDAVAIDLLREYVLCNCCRSGRARHRDRIEDIGLLIPLAKRWQDEILKSAERKASVLALEERKSTPPAHGGLNTPTSEDITPVNNPIDSQSYRQNNGSRPSGESLILSSSTVSLSHHQNNSSEVSTIGQPKYDLRPREAKISTYSTLIQPPPISPPTLSEFRTHLADPRPDDSVAKKFLNSLKGRDFETGSLYIFDRASSPGHVKIGWTAKSVSCRLEDWSKCGYTPNLLFSIHNIPHAQRVETLTHYELMKEWRRERKCKASWCQKSHQEWFEIENERAAQVLGRWADFMKRAEPYAPNGCLKSRWRSFVEMMDKNEEIVSAQKLLELIESPLGEGATLNGKPTDQRRAGKIEELVVPMIQWFESLEKASECLNSQRFEVSGLPTEKPLLKSEAPTLQAILTEKSLQKQETQLESDLKLQSKLLLTAKPQSRNNVLHQEQTPSQRIVFNAEAFPKTQSPPGIETSFQLLPALTNDWDFESLFKTESSSESHFKTKLLYKVEPIDEDVLNLQPTTVKNEPQPEEIPLPESPLIQPTLASRATALSQETESNFSAGIDRNSANDTIPNLKTGIADVDILIDRKTKSSIPTSVPAGCSIILKEDVPS